MSRNHRTRIREIHYVGVAAALCIAAGCAGDASGTRGSNRALPVTQGLELWLDASRLPDDTLDREGRRLESGDPVSVWYDASGRRRDLAAASPDFQPRFRCAASARGAGAAVRFDGVDDRLTARGQDLKTADFTLVAVCAPLSNLGNCRALASANAPLRADTKSGFAVDMGGTSRDDFGFLSVEGLGFLGEKNLMAGSAPFGTFHVLAVASTAAPDGTALRFDGAWRGRRNRDPQTLNLSEFRVGARRLRLYDREGGAFDDGFFHGDVAELFLFSRVLPDGELRALEGYLRKKHRALLEGGAAPDEPPQPPVSVLVPGFTVRQLPVRLTNINNVEYAADGRLFAVGYDGRVHVLTDTDGDGLEDRVAPYWHQGEGDLRTPIGMVVAPEGVYVACQGKVALLRDTDGDGAADVCETAVTGWERIRHQVDAIGLARDAQGGLYVGLGCADFSNPYLLDAQDRVHYDLRNERGTVLKVSADRAKREIVCTGLRFTFGLAINRRGDLFATDQEGATWIPDGNPLDELLHIQQGRHYGFPPRHPRYLPGVVDEPAVVAFSPQHQSSCGLKFNEAGEGRKSFGPAAWEGNALVAGESRGKVWRVPLVKTPAGYVGKPVLVASLTALTVDLAVSPAGDLLVACHGGIPDWGTGPKGEGRLYKISYSDPAAPQPVAAWPSGPRSVKVAFDRPIDAAALQAAIVCGEHVRAADRLERLRPPYKAVLAQKWSPRAEVRVAGTAVSADGRTLTLSTAAHPWRAACALTLSSVRAPGAAGAGATVDLAYDLSGVEAAWTPEGGDEPAWTGWLPHPDPEVVRILTAGSSEHDALAALLEKPGRLRLRAQMALPGEEAVLRLEAAAPFTAAAGSRQADSASAPGGGHAAELTWKAAPEPADVTVEVPTGGDGRPFSLHASYHTDRDPTERPIPFESLLLPWAPLVKAPAPAEPPPGADTPASGNRERGRGIFFGEAKCSACHAVRGEGGTAGPDLSNLIHWDPARALREIVDPGAEINPDYVNYRVELKDGRILSGVVFPEGADRVRIVDAEAKAAVVERAEIQEMNPLPVSLMPSNFRDLGEEKLRDLLAFLTTPPPRGAGTERK